MKYQHTNFLRVLGWDNIPKTKYLFVWLTVCKTIFSWKICNFHNASYIQKFLYTYRLELPRLKMKALLKISFFSFIFNKFYLNLCCFSFVYVLVFESALSFARWCNASEGLEQLCEECLVFYFHFQNAIIISEGRVINVQKKIFLFPQKWLRNNSIFLRWVVER